MAVKRLQDALGEPNCRKIVIYRAIADMAATAETRTFGDHDDNLD